MNLVNEGKVEFIPQLEKILQTLEDVDREDLSFLHECASVVEQRVEGIECVGDIIHDRVKR